MPIRRVTMKFLIPITVSGIKSENFNGRKLIPLYISPQDFSISENKLIQETFTKGGYYIEYWGEELPTISVSGTTGSGGIEAIEILRAIYRNEQIQMEQLLRDRARQIEDEANAALQDTSLATIRSGVVDAIDSLFENGLSEIINGVSSTIEEITDIFNENVGEETNPVTFIPSLGAFAVAVDLYMQGFKYRGFFKSFTVRESAETPGHFNYEFSFKVLRRIGRRRNFMPWHRNPKNFDGSAREASIPIEGPRIDELSYPSNIVDPNSITTTRAVSQFLNNQTLDLEPNNVGVSRFRKVRS